MIVCCYVDDHYVSICDQVMHESRIVDQTIMHCIFVGPPGVGKSCINNASDVGSVEDAVKICDAFHILTDDFKICIP